MLMFRTLWRPLRKRYWPLIYAKFAMEEPEEILLFKPIGTLREILWLERGALWLFTYAGLLSWYLIVPEFVRRELVQTVGAILAAHERAGFTPVRIAHLMEVQTRFIIIGMLTLSSFLVWLAIVLRSARPIILRRFSFSAGWSADPQPAKGDVDSDLVRLATISTLGLIGIYLFFSSSRINLLVIASEMESEPGLDFWIMYWPILIFVTALLTLLLPPLKRSVPTRVLIGRALLFCFGYYLFAQAIETPTFRFICETLTNFYAERGVQNVTGMKGFFGFLTAIFVNPLIFLMLGTLAYSIAMDRLRKSPTASGLLLARHALVPFLVASWLFLMAIAPSMAALFPFVSSPAIQSAAPDLAPLYWMGWLVSFFVAVLLLEKLMALFLRRRIALWRTKLLRSEVSATLLTPHLFSNYLSTLAYIVERGEKRTALEAISNTMSFCSRLTRLESSKPTWEMAEELKAIAEYCSTLQMQQNFSLRIQPSPECDLYKIPVLLLQPVIENIFKHEVRAQASTYTIEIEISTQVADNRVCVSIESVRTKRNTSGFEYVPPPPQRGRGLGLSIVRARVEAVGVSRPGTVTSEATSSGWRTVISLPLVR